MNMEKAEKIVVSLIVGFIALVLVFAFSQPYFEARTFNKFSKTKATYWDALVSELRVMPDRE